MYESYDNIQNVVLDCETSVNFNATTTYYNNKVSFLSCDHFSLLKVKRI